jgi:ketosteroid isomerase-like protein
MSQENIELLRRAVTLGNAGELEAVAELLHPDVAARDLQAAPGTPDVMHGRAAIVAVWNQWLEAFDDFRYEVNEYVDAHPWVVADVRWHATGKGSDLAIDWRVVEAYKVEGGKVTEAIFGLPDIPTALEAVGRSE